MLVQFVAPVETGKIEKGHQLGYVFMEGNNGLYMIWEGEHWSWNGLSMAGIEKGRGNEVSV